MKFALDRVAVLAATLALSLSAVHPASAWCGWWCRGIVVVPAPIILPAPVAVVPAPNPIPLPLPAIGRAGPITPITAPRPLIMAAASPDRAIAIGAAIAGTTPSAGASAISAV
jgi:hypothetical protein